MVMNATEPLRERETPITAGLLPDEGHWLERLSVGSST